MSSQRTTSVASRQLFLWILCISIALALLVALVNSVRTARRAAITSESKSPLNQLQVALLTYHDVHGHFPQAFIADEDGTRMHSWRVLILPYIEESALFDAYDFTEPWNGPNNSKLANQMPSIFGSPSEDKSKTFTNIVAITGPGTAFPGSKSTSLKDFVDGADNTILLTEITNSNVPWLQPRDIDTRESPFTANDPEILSMSSVPWRRPYIVFADSILTYAVQDNIPPEALRALTTIAGRESITRSKLISQGYLE
ncbi:MAG: DUF1559 domain-containing protein [Planctomycetes bacterium]|nr:DUF1559 domain-containing protein [Planctomycetota bacterium]